MTDSAQAKTVQTGQDSGSAQPNVSVSKAQAKQIANYEHAVALYEQQNQYGSAAFVIGVDEVGRGAVAGPLTVAAVCLPTEPMIIGLDDSKKLSAGKREKLTTEIREYARAIGIAHIEAEMIDRIGMAAALRQAMLEAISSCEAQLGATAEVVFIDGNPMHIHEREQSVVKGDSKIACIAAASIVAKVTRDAIMVAADATYPQYWLASNKGYAAATHIQAIKDHGLSAIHRRSFCTNFLQQSLF